MGKVIKLFSKRAKLVTSPFDFYNDLSNFVQVEPLIKFPFKEISFADSYQDYGFEPHKKVLLILGGSQGAQFLNSEALSHIMPSLDPSRWQVLHLAGHKSKVDEIKSSYHSYGIGHCVRLFEDNMQKAYQISDLVISRSGATTLFELAHYKKPALLVPFPRASEDHQLLNADYYVKHYPAAIIEEFLMDKVDIKVVFERLVSNENSFKDDAYFINHTTLDNMVFDLCLKK
jgi:UDP-N-acetylglucosamine--N-acetylmuramyl-(pentapeptide) pyrophosphoryl-undecaprenol N-acetylglucosamine transferase